MGLFDNQKIGVAFCTPVPKVRLANGQEILDTITMEWHRKRTALALGTNINFVEFFADGMEVGVARDGVARRCLAHDPVPEYVFFLDYDVLPEYDAFSKLFFRLQTMPKFDVAAGVYTCKWASPSDPLIYAGDGCGAFWDWTIGDLLTTEQHGITGTHMGLTLIRTSLFRRMLDAGVVTDEIPFFKTVKEQFKTPSGCLQTRSGTEDLYFYRLAAKVGCQILVDTSVLAGHIDKRTGITWGLPEDSPPVQRAKWIRGEDRDKSRFQVIKADTGDGCWVCDVGKTGGVQAWLHRDGWKPYLYLPGDPNSRSGVWATREDAEAALKASGVIAEPLKLALDLGAGGTRRSWPGHKTYTTDLRADSKPDYVQDTRWLNLPNDHYDLVACAPPGQRVLTPYGWAPIEKMKSGDIVLGRTGFVRVLNNFARDYSGPVFRIETSEGCCEVTGNHPIATPLEWVKADKLRESCEVFSVPTEVQPANLVQPGHVGGVVGGAALLRPCPSAAISDSYAFLAKLCNDLGLPPLSLKVGNDSAHELQGVTDARVNRNSVGVLASVGNGQAVADTVRNAFEFQPCADGVENCHVRVGNLDPRSNDRHDALAAATLPRIEGERYKPLPVNDTGEVGPVRVRHTITHVDMVSNLNHVGKVYNLETEDGTFFLEGILTHNSSHHMEHIPRFEQERAWGECFRVCKPGGAIEHIVPSGDWVAAKIADGQMDEHVMNVLYGAQESHGYERELNLHYFLYTKDLAKALAEAAGFADVRCEDWRDRPELGYNLIVRGTKPLPMAEEVRDGARTTFIATHAGPPPPAGGWPDDDEDDTDLHDPAPPEKPTMSILAALASCDLPPTAYVG